MRVFVLALTLAACTAGPPQAGSPPEPTPASEPTPAPAVQTQASLARVEGAWARAVPPGTPNSAIFLTIQNSGAALSEVVAGESAAAGSVELHTHTEVDGVMKMRRVERFAVPGSGHHHLRPGGDHIMLIGLTAPLAEGAQVSLTLTFADGSSLQTSVPVRSSPPEGAPGAAHDHGVEHGHGHPPAGTAAPADE